MQVSVIIVNWNGKKYLKNCLDSLLKQTYKNFEIILVDNGSTDGSVDFVKKNYKKVRIIQLDKNHGFSIANNIGIIESKAKYIAILNNDTKVDKNWLKEMVQVAEKDKSIGSCACKVLKYNNPKKIDNCGAGIYKNCVPFGRGDGESATLYTNLEEVFCINGTAALFRRKMLEDIKLQGNYFDSDYFFYCEEFDLSWRALLRGWKCVYVPNSIVYHIGSATGKKMPKVVKFHLERNRIWTIVKNLQTELIAFSLPHIIFYEIISLPFYILNGHLLSVLKGRLNSLVGIKKMLKKREIIQKRTKIKPIEVKKWMQDRNYLIQLKRFRN